MKNIKWTMRMNYQDLKEKLDKMNIVCTFITSTFIRTLDNRIKSIQRARPSANQIREENRRRMLKHNKI